MKNRESAKFRTYGRGLTRGDFLKKSAAAGVGLTGLSAFLAACGGGGASARVPKNGQEMPMDKLVAAAKDEGSLNTIALPPDWANYGEIMDTFTKKYGLKINNANPDGSSAEELQAVKSLKGQQRAPDVLDVGQSFAPQGKSDGILARYKNSNWETIPDFMKDPDGYWVGDYYGVIAFGVNADVVQNVPRTWDDLQSPEYKGKIAINGDPREAGAAFGAVYAASLANGGSLDDIGPGIDFFAELKKSGNLIPVGVTPATIANGQTPVTIDWDYLQTGYGDEFRGKLDWQVQIPTDSVFGNYYAQAINSDAPNPFSSRLWQEFLYSDQGQLLWLQGYTHPARFDDLVKRDAIPQALLDKLPPAEAYKQVQFPNAKQTEAATNKVKEEWGPKVASA